MNRRQVWTLGGVLLVVLVLAFALQDLVRLVVVIPIAYIWWAISILVGGVPQLVLWGFFVFLVTVMFFNSLTTQTSRRQLLREKTKPSQGNIETLATEIDKIHRGIYIKWQVANRLGRLARDLLIQRGDRASAKVLGPLTGRDWHPSGPVEQYLDAGLNGSFAEYPNPSWPFGRSKPTPLDLDVNEAVEFIEAQMETNVRS